MSKQNSKPRYFPELFYLVFSLKELKDLISEIGILVAFFLYCIVSIFIILFLPVLPFFVFNQWSKTWFSSKKEVSSDGQ